MPNSSFQKNNAAPITVPEGGIGVSSVPYGGVLIGAGSGNVNTVSPGALGNVLKSDGTNWTSGTPDISDGSVTYPKIDTDLTQIIDASLSNNIDWSLGGIYIKTLTSNTTLTFSNYKLNKSILLKIDGNFSLALPISVKKISGAYLGTDVNYIFLHCTKDTSPQEVWATINQRLVTGYGYISGGYYSSNLATTDRIVFSTSTTLANTVSNLAQARYGLVGVSDSSTYGYFVGGWSSLTVADRIIFSTGVTSANTASNASQGRQYSGGTSDGITYGYISGAYVTSATTDRIVFSTSVTSANTASTLSIGRYSLAGISDSSTYGYFGGGASPSIVATTDRMIFSTGVISANTASNLSTIRNDLAGLYGGALYGYFAGGNSGSNVATADRIIFSTSVTSANTVSNLSITRRSLASSSDGSNNGYFSGGDSSGAYNVALTDKIIFSNGVTSANTTANLSQGRTWLAGLSDCSV